MVPDIDDIIRDLIDAVIEEDKSKVNGLIEVERVKRVVRGELKKELLSNKDKYKEVIKEEIIYV